MRRMNLRNNLNVAFLIGGSIVAASALGDDPQQSGSSMGSGMMGGYGMGGFGGVWVPSCLSPSLPASWGGSSRKRESEPIVGAAGQEAGCEIADEQTVVIVSPPNRGSIVQRGGARGSR